MLDWIGLDWIGFYFTTSILTFAIKHCTDITENEIVGTHIAYAVYLCDLKGETENKKGTYIQLFGIMI